MPFVQFLFPTQRISYFFRFGQWISFYIFANYYNVGHYYLLSLSFYMDFFFSLLFFSFLFFSFWCLFIWLSRFCIVCVMCVECNKNVVQCLLHFINLKTNFLSVCVRARAKAHTRVRFLFHSFLTGSMVGSRFCICLLMADKLAGWWPIPTITRWVATPIIDKLNGNICDGLFSRCCFYFLSFCLFIPTAAIEYSIQFGLVWFGVRIQEFHMQINRQLHTLTLNKTILDNWLYSDQLFFSRFFLLLSSVLILPCQMCCTFHNFWNILSLSHTLFVTPGTLIQC